jgi:hypothetical protein
VSALVALLRSARASGRPVSLRARGGWPAASFFCSVSVSSSLGEHLAETLAVLEAPVFRSVRA